MNLKHFYTIEYHSAHFLIFSVSVNIYFYFSDEPVELRKKPEGNNIVVVDRNSKPAIPERPAGLARPSSLIRHTRQSNENLDSDSGVGRIKHQPSM